MERINRIPHSRATTRYGTPASKHQRINNTYRAACPFCGAQTSIQNRSILDHSDLYGFHCAAVGFLVHEAAAMTIDAAGDVFLHGRTLDEMRRFTGKKKAGEDDE